MCGIAGCVVAPGRRPDVGALECMAAALSHRGPDDHGVEVIGSVGLVHTRLAIVDPSPAGHQPMAGRDGRWWLTYNGEIFNHLGLREQLPPGPYRGGSDTETLLRALDHWGDAAIARCNGLFAYAALDVDRNRLLLVRDRFGVKPLYVARHANALWFASEIGALLAAGVPRRPRADVLDHALQWGWANGPWTPIEGVLRVMPGRVMMVDLETLGSQERTWYEPAEAVDPERAAALASRSREQLAAELEDELRASVKRRLMADVPLGTMCSGGIDSSLITALAHDEDEGLVAYNAAVVDQPDADESPFAEQVTNHLGVELRSVQMTAETWRADLVDVVRHVEYPLTHESSVPMFQIAALAREDGVKVLLSGEGADELLAGYEWLHLREQIDFTHRRGSLERAARAAYRRLRGRRLPGDRSGRARSADVDSFERQLSTRARAAYRHHRGVRASYEAALLADLGTYLPHLLNRQDKSTMKASIETRVPFLDPEVVALAVNLPLEARAEPQLKGILRELAVARLPREIVDRPKRGFGFDAEAYIRAAARSQFLEEGALREVCGATSGQWRERVAAARGNDALLLWSGEIWCRALLEGQSTEQIELALWTAH